VDEKTGGNPFFAIQFSRIGRRRGSARVRLRRSRPGGWTSITFAPRATPTTWWISWPESLKRLSATTQDALIQFACLGNVAEIAVLTLVHGETEQMVHGALREAVHAGLVVHLGSAYKFLHDRIQQAAYSLIPEVRRAEVHVRLGRALRSSMTADQFTEHLLRPRIS